MVNLMVIARLLYAGLLLLIKWAILQPCHFIGGVFYFFGKIGSEYITAVLGDIKLQNDQALNEQT